MQTKEWKDFEQKWKEYEQGLDDLTERKKHLLDVENINRKCEHRNQLHLLMLDQNQTNFVLDPIHVKRSNLNRCCSNIWVMLKWIVFLTSLLIVTVECFAVYAMGSDATLLRGICLATAYIIRAFGIERTMIPSWLESFLFQTCAPIMIPIMPKKNA
jgi:hypothetical protein